MWHDSITPGGDAAALAAASDLVATENAAAEDATGALSRPMLKMIELAGCVSSEKNVWWKG